MKYSQYLDAYKQHFYNRLEEGKRPQSVGTWVSRQLAGNARKWNARYRKSLIASLNRTGWIPCQSEKNGLAYSPCGLEPKI